MPAFDDRYGVPTVAANAAAVAHLDAAIDEFLRFGVKGGDHLGAALTADADMVLAHFLKAYFMRLGNDPALFLIGRDAMYRGQHLMLQGGGGSRERHHAAAARAWYSGNWSEAVHHWQAAVTENPRDILALWVSQLVLFFQGEDKVMCADTARVQPHWKEWEPGADYVQAMHAFALEETNDFARAEALGRKAVERNPLGVWGVHAVAHVLEANSRLKEGVAWLKGLEPHWSPCGNFAYHMWWHRALYHVELEEYPTVLDLYDRGVRPVPSMDYMDISNAAALLWRLKSRGVDVGRRFDELSEKCVIKKDDHLLPFSQAHFALTLASTGRREALASMVESCRIVAQGTSSVARATKAAVLPVAEAAAKQVAGDFAGAVATLMPVRAAMVRIGGSHAQRDVFAQWLIDCAFRAGDFKTARALLSERTAAHPGSPSAWKRLAEAARALGDSKAAGEAEAKARQLLAA